MIKWIKNLFKKKEKVKKKRKVKLDTKEQARRKYVKKKLKENPDWKPRVKKTPEEVIQARKDRYWKNKKPRLIDKRKTLSHLTPEEKVARKKKIQRDKYVEKKLKENPDWKPRVKKTPEEQRIYINEYNRKIREKKGCKPRVKKIKIDKPKKKRYLNDKDLRKEIMISKENGKTTEKLKLMLFEMCKRINSRFNYYDEDMRYDIMMSSYVDVMIWYPQFNPKYEKSFPYITELIKRSHANHFKQQVTKGLKGLGDNYGDIKKTGFVSQTEIHNL